MPLDQTLFHSITQVYCQPYDLISYILILEARALAEALRSVLFELLKYQMEINKVNELKKIARASISDGQAREQKLNNARLGTFDFMHTLDQHPRPVPLLSD